MESLTPVSRVAGALLLVMGSALAALLIAILVTHSARPIPLAVVTAIAAGLSAFLLVLGYRLAFNRPNRHGTLLSPLSWNALGVFFVLLGAFMALPIRADNLVPALGTLGTLGTLSTFLLAYCCFLAARGVRFAWPAPAAAPAYPPSRVFSPETSLLGMEGFAPEGFRCGVEILNDDRTPMEFVVAVLRKHLDLDESQATRVMLDIHSKGGVIVARDSLEESKRIADTVSAEARVASYPLVCRAVSVEVA